MATSQPRGRRQRALHEVDRVGDRLEQRSAVCEPRRHCRRQRAPGSMGGLRVEPRMREPAHRAVGEEDVHDMIPRQVPAGHERGACSQLYQGRRGARHLLRVAHVVAGQDSCFVKVRCDERGEGNQARRDQARGVGMEWQGRVIAARDTRRRGCRARRQSRGGRAGSHTYTLSTN